MKRSEIIKKLVTEGFSTNLLSTFNDKQIMELSDRILSEQNGEVVVNVDGDDDQAVDALKKDGKTFVTYEEDLPEEDCGCDDDKEIEETEETVNVNEWVEKLVRKNINSNITTKKEIMEMIQRFRIEDEVEPMVKPKIAPPVVKPGTKPERKSPYKPAPGTNPAPKGKGVETVEPGKATTKKPNIGHNGVPEFMTHD